MNAKIMAMMMVGVMMFSGLAVLMDSDENDATNIGGTLFGTGHNNEGQQGDGTLVDVTSPKQIGSYDNVTMVGCSNNTTFYIDSNRLFGMGDNEYGQQGDGTLVDVTSPKQIGSYDNVTMVACSTKNTAFINDGKLYAMGNNDYGSLGIGSSSTNIKTPTQVGSFTNVTYVEVTNNNIAFIDDGKLYAAGRNDTGVLGVSGAQNSPVQIGTFTNVQSLNLGGFNLLFMDGTNLYGIGSNNSGVLGDNSTTNSDTPVLISDNVSDYGFNDNNSLIFVKNSQMYHTGNTVGPFVAVTTPTLISGYADVTDVYLGQGSGGNSLLFINDSKLYGVGENTYGQISGNSTVISNITQVGTFTNVDKVVSSGHTTFFKNGTDWYSIGRNNYGQMGDNTTSNVKTPKQITVENVADVFVSQFTTFFITIPPTATISLSSNNSGYGSVSSSSISDVDIGTTISISSNTLTIGDTTVTATPTADTAQYDYSFTGWYDGSTQLVGGETVTGDMTITATFARSLQEYTVTATASSYGSVSPSSVTQPYGSAISASGNVLTIGSQTITATPDTADAQYTYTFTGWSTFPSTLTANTSVTANFDRTVNTYTITWSISGSTTSETLSYGAMPEHEDPVPPEGYLFKGWNPEIAAVTGDQTYTAVFEEIVYITVTFDPNGGQLEGSATKTVGIGTPYGELPTPKKDNNKFLGWYTDPEEGTLVTADTIVPEDAGTTLYAHWELTGFAAMLKPLLFLFPLILLAFLAIALVRTFA